MCSKKKIFLLMLILLITSGIIRPSLAARGRPHIDSSRGYNVLLTDKNTLLRGVSLSWDGGDPYGSRSKVMPSQAQLNDLSEKYGLNTLHLYLEGDSAGNTDPIGYNAADCDALVQKCGEAGLYLIITIGCNGENGNMNLAWSQRFWEFYAPRYKNETHVIYEAHNEPAPNTIYQWQRSDWVDQAALYRTIRTAAPDTFILLGSFMGFVGDARDGVGRMKSGGVDWGNAGLAHHGYESKEGIEQAISIIQSSTKYPALLCTEFWPGDTTGQEYNNMYERHFNGWVQFMWLAADDVDLFGAEDGFQTKINKAGTIWTPDNPSATWPAKGTPRIPQDGARIGILSRGEGKFLSVDSMDGHRLKADRESLTGKKAEYFIVEKGPFGEVSLKASNGYYLSVSNESIPIKASAQTAGNTEQFIWMELPNGYVALRSISNGMLLSTAAGEGSSAGRLRANACSGTSLSSHFAIQTDPAYAP